MCDKFGFFSDKFGFLGDKFGVLKIGRFIEKAEKLRMGKSLLDLFSVVQ